MNISKAKNKLLNIRGRLLENHSSAVMERVEIAMFYNFFSDSELSLGTIRNILRSKAMAIMTRTHLMDDIRIVCLAENLHKIAEAVADPTGFEMETAGKVFEQGANNMPGRAGAAIRSLGRANQYFATHLSLKTMTNVTGVVLELMSEPRSFDFWRNDHETQMVRRLERAGFL
ncbi:hypothetical protein [Alkalimonas amylolytica]|uniref:Uncharacterized protein n=1 Tax=Alkalimonas amylolytica TaxID=152573 RepID=A0A1H3Y4P1_ALKAM|nr:hypothetical protein [Alkalimonas amylolytica]SEA06596.1 hypothetical protein SAMN04488051_101541 [Alkalimonas amylolytica]